MLAVAYGSLLSKITKSAQAKKNDYLAIVNLNLRMHFGEIEMSPKDI